MTSLSCIGTCQYASCSENLSDRASVLSKGDDSRRIDTGPWLDKEKMRDESYSCVLF